MEKFGIDNLKKVLNFGVSFGLHLSTELKDGFDYYKIFALVPDLMQVPDLLKNKQAIMDEVKDLSVEEIAALITSVENSALITSDKVKEIISIAVDILQAVVKLVGIFKPAA